MPDTKIFDLPSKTVASSDIVPVVDSAGAATSRVTAGQIAALGGGAPATHASSHAAVGGDPITPASIGAIAEGDSRLTNARTPNAHASSHASNGSDPVTPAAIGAAEASHAHTLVNVSDAGTAASRNVPASGDAGASQVVLGSDTRLTNSRAPTTHASSHAIGGTDYIPPVCLSPAAISVSQNNYGPGLADVLYLTSSSNISITGLSSSGIPDGHPVMLINANAAGGGTITLPAESSSSLAANRFRPASGASVLLSPDGGSVLAVYHAAISRWRLL